MTKSHTYIPGSIDEILIPGDELFTEINNRSTSTKTVIMLEYTERGIFYNGIYYTKPSAIRKAMNKIYLPYRKTFEDRGWTSIFRTRDNASLHDLRMQFNSTRL